jgi:hypothetical protein
MNEQHLGDGGTLRASVEKLLEGLK